MSVTRQMDQIPTASAGEVARAQLRRVTTMWRNVCVYPPEHPRVTAAVAAVLQHLASVPAAERAVHVRDGQLHLCGASFPLDDDDALALVARLQEVGLRGFELTEACTPADVIAFLQAARQNRRQSSDPLVTRWPGDHPRLRALPLSFDGGFQDGPVGPGGKGGAKSPRTNRPAGAPSSLPTPVRAALQQVAADPEILARLRQLEQMTDGGAGGDNVTLPLLDHLGRLLPADVGHDPAAIAATVRTILSRVERDLGEVVHRGARVRGSDLMRQALTMARTVFGTSATPMRRSGTLPAGRPEDEAIVADVDLLRTEFSGLPDDPMLALPVDVATGNASTAKEMFGICLHVVVQSRGKVGQGTGGPRRHLVRLLESQGKALRGTWGAYVHAATGNRRDAERRVVLQALLDGAAADAAAIRPMVDAAFFAASFPESLAGCVRLLGGDEPGRAVLRQGLQLVSPLLQLGGADATERCGALADPLVVATLLELGAPEVRELLPSIARQATGAAQDVVLEHVRKLDLAPAAKALLALVPQASALPPTFLPRLLAAWLRQPSTPTMTQECHELLRDAVRRQLGSGTLTEKAAAVAALGTAPDPQTRSMLQELARNGRWTRWDLVSRTIRKAARATLANLEVPT
ncbi:MAG: hypothetical protein JNL12_07465 [Planctomycetes bacterium]|nr:hypothetical protein [Planctomycetota bacterium]